MIAHVAATAAPTTRRRRAIVVEWVPPLVVALVILGPVLRPGVLFNLDLVLPSRLDTPSGFWGLGPELPRRLPMWTVIAWLSALVPATTIGKISMVAVIVFAWVGMARLVVRLVPTASTVVVLGAAVLYSLSPFVLTRSLVGHFMVTVPHAVLPWVLPVLVERGRRNGSLFLACLALGVAGHFGGSVALTVVAVATIAHGRRGAVTRMAVALAAQAPWLVPGLLVAATTDIRMVGTGGFPTDAAGFTGLARLSAGGGFWNEYFQVGGAGVAVSLIGAVLLALGVLGTRSLTPDHRRTLVALGVLGWVVAAASVLGGVSTVVAWVDDHLLGGIWRDGQRLLTLHLIWLAPAASAGAGRCAQWCREKPGWRPFVGSALVAPLALGVALATPGVWGFGGRLAADALPSSWNDARGIVRAEPGTVLTLPWTQYFNLQLGDGDVRRVLNPLPLFLGGDVLASSDNGLSIGDDATVQEIGDPREGPATRLVEEIARGAHTSDELAALGVRWVVVVTTPLPEASDGLRDDPGFRVVVDTPELALYENTRWLGPAVDASGGPVTVDRWGPAWATIGDDGPITWFRAGTGGWRRGWDTVDVDARGLLQVPAGGAPVWNVATLPSLVAAVVPTLVAGWIVVRRRPRTAVHAPRSI